jgi:hypothetical protein
MGRERSGRRRRTPGLLVPALAVVAAVAAIVPAAAGPAWPSGTTAAASSYHAPNSGDNGQPRTHVAGNAIDGNTDTFWNDANPATYPATLTITAPSAVSLRGSPCCPTAPPARRVRPWRRSAASTGMV